LEKKDYPLIKDAKSFPNKYVPIKYQDKRLLLNSVGKLFKRRRSLFVDAKKVSSWNRREDERAYKVRACTCQFCSNRLARKKTSRLKDKSFN